MLSDDNFETKKPNRFRILIIIYTAMLLDNILLTVIVPILPDYLTSIKSNTTFTTTIPKDLHYNFVVGSKHPLLRKQFINFVSLQNQDSNEILIKKNTFDTENGSIGVLLAVKAFVQLIFNPIVGTVSSKLGYRVPILIGTLCLLFSSFVFAIGETYVTLLIARGVQGIGSACISVSGMSLVAQLYPDNNQRSKIMGIVLGSVALGVLMGYPFGGVLYDFVSKSAPFYILSVFIFINFVFQIVFLDLYTTTETSITTKKTEWSQLLLNKLILGIVFGIFLSTTAMAVLEPCLPIWLIENIHPKKWQLGAVFIPDSIGYFIGTNFFGTLAFNYGQIKVSCISLILVGTSSIAIPVATTVFGLLIPHFTLGFGIGVIDAALVPLLASYVDSKGKECNPHQDDPIISNYGTVYAIQQTSVSLAYSFGPLFGGFFAEHVGFPWLMRCIGILNILYAPALYKLYKQFLKHDEASNKHILLTGIFNETSKDYKRFYNAME